MRRGVVLFLAACSMFVVSSALSAETIAVTIDKMKFDPAEVSAHIGDTIEWTNKDVLVHTATARSKDWDVVIPAKGVARLVLRQVGDVDYYCRFHPNMTGKVSVRAP